MAVNVPTPSEPIAAQSPPGKTWYRFFVDLLRQSTGNVPANWDAATVTAALASLGFETGTFTPTMAFVTVGSSTWVYVTQTGIYVKQPRLCTVFITLVMTPTIGTGSGEIRVGGLPFAADLAGMVLNVGNLDADWTWPAARTQVYAVSISGETNLQIRAQGTAGNAVTLGATNMTDGSQHALLVTGAYRTAT